MKKLTIVLILMTLLLMTLTACNSNNNIDKSILEKTYYIKEDISNKLNKQDELNFQLSREGRLTPVEEGKIECYQTQLNIINEIEGVINDEEK